MIPDDVINKIRSVTIYHNFYIDGFSFFDKDGARLLDIGDTYEGKKETVVLKENEVIVGVKAKLYSHY